MRGNRSRSRLTSRDKVPTSVFSGSGAVSPRFERLAPFAALPAQATFEYTRQGKFDSVTLRCPRTFARHEMELRRLRIFCAVAE